MPNTTTGTRTGQSINSDQKIRDVDSLLWTPGTNFTKKATEYPFTSLIKSHGKSPLSATVKAQEFEVGQRMGYYARGTITGTYNTTATDLVINAAMYNQCRINDQFFIPNSREVVRVRAKIGSNTIRVLRGVGAASEGTGTAITATGWELHVAGSASPEGGNGIQAISYNNEYLKNYVQIHEDAASVSKSNQKQAQYNDSDPFKTEIYDMQDRFKMKRERAFLFGRKSKGVDPDTGEVIYATGGVIQFLENDHVISVGDATTAEVTYDAILGWMEEIQENTSGQVYWIAGPGFHTCLSRIMAPFVRVIDGKSAENKLNLNMTEFVANNLTVRFVRSPKIMAGDNDRHVLSLDFESGTIQEAIFRPSDYNDNAQVEKADRLEAYIREESGLKMVGNALGSTNANATGEKQSPHALITRQSTAAWV